MNKREALEAAVWAASLPDGTEELPESFDFYVCDDGMNMLSDAEVQYGRMARLRDYCGANGYVVTEDRDDQKNPWLTHWVFKKMTVPAYAWSRIDCRPEAKCIWVMTDAARGGRYTSECGFDTHYAVGPEGVATDYKGLFNGWCPGCGARIEIKEQDNGR